MKKCLSLLPLILAAVAAAQPPAAKQPAKAPRMHFDQDVGRQVPVIEIPPEELVPTGKMLLLAEGPDWGVTKLNVPAAHKVTKGKGVKVCVLDTGLDYTHPDFGGVPQERMKSFVPGQSVMDVQGHGTHCMGRVAARGVNHGVAPEAEIWAGKVLDNSGSGAVTWIAAGVDWATANNLDVISLSLGGGSTDSYIPPAFERAEAAGVIIVAATGNSGPGDPSMNYPGGYKQAFGTAALDKNLTVARFSSRGANTFWCLPGVDVVSQYPGGRQAPMSGTSMATPHGAGVAALWVAANPQVPKKERPAAFRKAYPGVAIDLGPVGRDTAYGYGFVDVSKLVGSAPPPDPKDPPKGFTGDVAVVVSFVDGKPVGVKLGAGTVSPTADDLKKLLAPIVTESVNGAFGGVVKVGDTTIADWKKALLDALVKALLDALAEWLSGKK